MNTQWIYETDTTGNSPLVRASKSGRHDMTNLMLLQEQIDNPNYFRDLPELQRAVCWGLEDVVAELIREGVDVQEYDSRGETALHKAVRMGRYNSAVCLLDHDADVNAQDALGMTPLHWAALTGNEEMTELLLSQYADVETRDYFTGGMTPMAVARLMGYVEVVRKMRSRFTFY